MGRKEERAHSSVLLSLLPLAYPDGFLCPQGTRKEDGVPFPVSFAKRRALQKFGGEVEDGGQMGRRDGGMI